MKSVLDQVVSSADEKLALPAGKPFDVVRPQFKKFIETQSTWLRSRHGAGIGGLEFCRARAALMDAVLRNLLRALWPEGSKPLGSDGFALVATGGYGRSELNPGSDIDLMFLEAGGVIKDDGSTPLSKLPPAFVQELFDIGLEPGDHATRTIAQCVDLANRDIETKTSLLEARLIAGDAKLFARLQQAVTEKCIRGQEDAYIQARLEDQQARRTRAGNQVAMQQPNIKNGVGGLRDFQNLLWMALVKYGVGTLEGLQEREMLSSKEREELEEAYDFLLRARTQLHFLAGRTEVLTPNWQPGVAAGLKFEGNPRLRTQKFMRAYYTHARNIFLITRTLEQRLALTETNSTKRTWRDLLKLRRRAPSSAQEVDGFRILGTQLHFADRRVLHAQPRRLMRAFLHAQQRGLTLHPDLAQLMRQQVGLADDDFRRDDHVRETFFEILNNRGNVAPVLRAMHEVGLLGQYIPEFGGLTNLVQHEHYHIYAVDEHTLMCIEKLDKVWNATDSPYDRYGALFRNLERPYVLYLALLLHDSGKAVDSGAHAEVGGRLAIKVSERLHLDGATTHTLRVLIEQHLTMVRTGQTLDLDDPDVIRDFCSHISTLETLDLLTLHTFADSMGTSETLWTGFKDTLHWQLYHRAAEFLRGDKLAVVAEQKQRELLMEETRALLPKTWDPAEIPAHFSDMPARYFQIHSPRDIARDLAMAHEFYHLQRDDEGPEDALIPVLQWHDERDRGYAVVHICTWDREALFSKITGALAATTLNILGAQVFTRLDHVIFDEFYVTDARTGELPTKQARQQFAKILNDVLHGRFALKSAIQKTKLYRPLWQGVPGDRIETHVTVDNHAATDRTLITVETEDRIGLLYAISAALVDLRLDLILAKIVTERGAAIDSFYVTEIGGGKVLDEERRNAVAEYIEKAISSLD
jgi:[protein-PII] uridylyltransferase